MVSRVHPRLAMCVTADIKSPEKNVTNLLCGENPFYIEAPTNLEECVLVCDGCVKKSIEDGGRSLMCSTPVIQGGCNMTYGVPS
jgi:hypothetical protein